MKIVDSFIFYNELDLLEYRLKLLEPVVNNFVLVESTQTFAGHQKPLYYQENKDRFREYNHKIQHVVVDSFQPDDAWFNEKLQRESITQGLEMLRLHDEDAIMITDVDEIPDPRVIMQVGLNVEFRHMPMDWYFYNLNWRLNSVLRAGKIIRYHSFKQFDSVKAIRDFPEKFGVGGAISPRCGWHMSYFGDAEWIHNKMNSYSHQESEVQSINNVPELQRRIDNGLDLYSTDRGIKLQHVAHEHNKYLPPGWQSITKMSL
jgi:beta-1,4-mannosyl-glycoprotein beta-1,4-N-acetylglucosaminyltransferase